jgi:hypothetical protein
MVALVIWGGDDHKVRAQALATTYATTAQNVTVKPKKVSTLETLVFWGHGDPKHFCHLTPDEFVALVTSWKKLNSGLESVEILTCNSRHKNGAFTDSYTEQVVKKLTTKHSAIQFRALPIATTKKGVTCEWSILKWHDASATWAYVGAPTNTLGSSSQTDSIMHDAVKLLEDFMPPRGQHIGYARAIAAMEGFAGLTTTNLYATKRKWGQAEVDKYNKAAKETRENTFIMAGTLSGLRWWLTDIR